MTLHWCEKCKSWNYGEMTTGGFTCIKCGRQTIYIGEQIFTDGRKLSGYYV